MRNTDHPISKFAKSNGLTISDVAERASLSRSQVQRIMAGKETKLGTLRRLSEATGGKVSIAEIAEFER